MSEELKTEIHSQDPEINELIKKGLEDKLVFNEPACPSTADCSRRGNALVYHECSEKDAGVLRRMLATGPPVKKLCIWDISLTAFRVAFEGLEECSSLEELQLRHISCPGEVCSIKIPGVFNNLRSLTLSFQNVSATFATDIASYLRENKILREFALCYSCGGDEGAAALIEALTVNDTLKRFSFSGLKLSSETMISIAKMLTTNSTLELVDIFDACFVEDDSVSALLEQYGNAGVFKRFRIVWTGKLLPLLTRLIGQKACWPGELSIGITASVDRDVLGEFFEAVATDTALRMLHFYPSDDVFDALADGIASVAKQTASLKEIQNLMFVKKGNEHQLVKVLDALKENRSLTSFTMYAELLTPPIATSLSELLAVNDTLNEVSVCEYWGITADIVATILRGLRKNYTLTHLMVSWDPDDDVEGVLEMEELLKRNVRLHEKAAEFVSAGGDSDAEGADALKKVRSSANLVEKVQRLTGKTSDAAMELIHSVLARLDA